MVTLSTPVLMCAVLFVVAAGPAGVPTVTTVTTRSVIMFAPPPAEIDQLTDRDISIQDFLAYWVDIQKRLRDQLPRVAVLETDANQIVLPDRTVTRAKTLHGYGFVFFTPERGTRVIDGLMTPDDCLEAARGYFDQEPAKVPGSPRRGDQPPSAATRHDVPPPSPSVRESQPPSVLATRPPTPATDGHHGNVEAALSGTPELSAARKTLDDAFHVSDWRRVISSASAIISATPLDSHANLLLGKALLRSRAPYDSVQYLAKAIDLGEEVDVPIKYNGAVPGYVYLYNGIVSIRRDRIEFQTSGGIDGFSATPAEISAVTNDVPARRVRVRAFAKNHRAFFGHHVGPEKENQDFFFYNTGAVAAGSGPGGTGLGVECGACDESMDVLYELLRKVTSASPVADTQPARSEPLRRTPSSPFQAPGPAPPASARMRERSATVEAGVIARVDTDFGFVVIALTSGQHPAIGDNIYLPGSNGVLLKFTVKRISGENVSVMPADSKGDIGLVRTGDRALLASD
jgi:hypothetical protein